MGVNGGEMACFCLQTMSTLLPALQRAADAVPLPEPEPEQQPEPEQKRTPVRDLANWLAARGLPAPPWTPDPDWLQQPVPVPVLEMPAMTTLLGLAQVSQLLTVSGIDPLAQPVALTRLVATLNARLPALEPPDPTPWQALAAENAAADQVREALALGLFDPPPDLLQAYAEPAEQPMRQWLPFLRQIRALAPLIAVPLQFDLDPQEPDLPAQLAQRLKPLRSLTLPPVADLPKVLSLTSLFSAVAQLRESLGVDPLQSGLDAIRDQVRAKIAALPPPPPLDELPSQAALPYCPTRFAPPAVVTAALSRGVETLAATKWQVPPPAALPALQTGMPVLALITQLGRVLPRPPAQLSPCMAGCDAGRIMRALGTAANPGITR
jgi:hypothetical protein